MEGKQIEIGTWKHVFKNKLSYTPGILDDLWVKIGSNIWVKVNKNVANGKR